MRGWKWELVDKRIKECMVHRELRNSWKFIASRFNYNLRFIRISFRITHQICCINRNISSSKSVQCKLSTESRNLMCIQNLWMIFEFELLLEGQAIILFILFFRYRFRWYFLKFSTRFWFFEFFYISIFYFIYIYIFSFIHFYFFILIKFLS